jgi:hypothetical protein
MRRQIVGIFTLKGSSNEKLFSAPYGSSGDYHSASDFVPGRCQRHHSHCDSWQRRVLLLAFIGDDSPKRYSAVNLELGRSQ